MSEELEKLIRDSMYALVKRAIELDTLPIKQLRSLHPDAVSGPVLGEPRDRCLEAILVDLMDDSIEKIIQTAEEN